MQACTNVPADRIYMNNDVQNFVYVKTHLTLQECNFMCMRDSICVEFFHNEVEKKCNLLKNLCAEDAATLMPNGW